MPHRITLAVIAAVLVVTAVGISAPQPAHANSQKVAVIVGPVGGLSDLYRSLANKVATAATARGATVVKAYSPTATWSNVRAAVNGANVIVYFGHGNGFPNPYGVNELTDRSNGWGLNTATTNGDADSWSNGTLVYCGEKALLGTLTSSDGAAQRQYCGGTSSGGITPAPNFTMVYAQAHYAPGFGERYTRETPLTTHSEAQQRVRHYSTPILQLGGTYLATAYGDADAIVSRVLAHPNRTYADLFADGNYSPSTATSMAHPDVSGAQVWVQRTTISNLHFGDPDYWYAFAGNPRKTPAGGTATPTVSTPPAQVSGSSVILDRLAGADRYATAAAISKASFGPGVAVAYVATGANFPDALAAGAAAARLGGPVLLTGPSSIPGATTTELARLKPKAIKVVGGPGVVSGGVLDQLRSFTAGPVTRISGANRYATAAAISKDAFGSGVPVAYISTGENFPDALAGVAAAGTQGGPVLLTRPKELSPETRSELTRLRPGRIAILGASGAVSDGVRAALAAYTTGGVTRLAGADRYATSVAISAGTFTTAAFGQTERTVFIATGAAFPDALGGGPVAGSLPAPMLLVPGTSLPSSVAAELVRLNPGRVVFLGGTGAISNTVVSQVQKLLGP